MSFKESAKVSCNDEGTYKFVEYRSTQQREHDEIQSNINQVRTPQYPKGNELRNKLWQKINLQR